MCSECRHMGSFGQQLEAIKNLVWQLLPNPWKPASSLKMYYGFHPDNPKLRRDGNRGSLTYSTPVANVDDQPIMGFTNATLASRYFAVKAGETDVRAVGDIDYVIREYLVDRAWLQETYDDAADEHRRQGEEEANSGYVRPDYIHFRFYTLRMNRAEPNGSKISDLMNRVYRDFEGTEPGDCVFRIIQETFAGRRNPLKLTIPEMRARCEIPEGGVTYADFPKIEQYLVRESPLTKKAGEKEQCTACNWLCCL